MKKILLIALTCFMVNICAYANDNEILDKIKLQRDSIYSSLDLTQEQANQINEIDKRRYEAFEGDMAKFSELINRLEELSKSDNCTIEAVNVIKNEFKPVQKDLSKLNRKFEKEFKSVLTPEQKIKYKEARIQKREELREEIEKQKALLMNEAQDL